MPIISTWLMYQTSQARTIFNPKTCVSMFEFRLKGEQSRTVNVRPQELSEVLHILKSKYLQYTPHSLKGGKIPCENEASLFFDLC